MTLVSGLLLLLLVSVRLDPLELLDELLLKLFSLNKLELLFLCFESLLLLKFVPIAVAKTVSSDDEIPADVKILLLDSDISSETF